MFFTRGSQIGIFSGFLAVVCAGYLSAAPLEGGFAAAPAEARSKVLAAAAQYEKTPYKYGGLDKRGLDCSGFVFVSFRDALGVSVPRSTGGLYSWAETIAIENANPGDLLFFKTTGNGKISHVGIYLGNRRFIHAASEGPSTGVIYSNLDERYWSRTYAGAGRALPAANGESIAGSSHSDGNYGDSSNGGTVPVAQKQKKDRKNGNGSLLMGVAVAPTWGAFSVDGGAVRGAAGQFRIGTAVAPFGKQMIFGVELRPEWDGVLGVFRLPLTLSWGLSDRVRIFGGPVLSFGDAALSVSGESREYTGGTSWFGAAGITVAPFAFNIAGGQLAPYGELAWQSYFSNNNPANAGADIAAGFRFSTGLRYTWRQ